MSKVLVTGGSGNVGRFVVRELLRHHGVVVFDTRAPEEESAATFAQGDILRGADLATAMRGVDAVVHLAAIPSPNTDTAGRVVEVNAMGTHRVLDAAAKAGVRRVVFASSDSTLGFVFGRGDERPDYLPIDEEHPLRPADPYGLSKMLGEQILAQHTRLYGMTTIALRYCWVWFPPEYPDTTELSKALDNARRTLGGYVDARDVARAVRLALEARIRGHEAFYITAADTYLTMPTLEFVNRALPELPRLNDPTRYVREKHAALFSTEKARRMLEFVPSHTWRTGT